MTYLIRIRPQAERDVDEAYSWYERQRPGLGKELLSELDKVLLRLSKNPYMHRKIHRGVRRAITRRFPIAVFYIATDTEIRVLAVVNMARDVSAWQKRI
jgi:plasmid stabilization system protein ParE